MKPLSLSSLLLLFILLAGSCKKIPVIEKSNSFISFKIDGTAKEAKGNKNVFAIYIKQEGILQIIGNIGSSDDQQISLTVNNFHGVGEYTAEDDFLALYDTPEVNESIIGNEGKIKITEYIEGKKIKGEFQFTGEAFVIPIGTDVPVVENKIFSDGKFEMKPTTYTDAMSIPGFP